MELKANKRPENASLAWYVDSLQAEGRYSFCKEEALEKMRLSAEALKKAVARLVSRWTPWKRLQEIIGSAEYNAFIEMMEKLPDSQAKRHIREVALHYDEKVVDATPSVWVGEVSWLKAAVSGDNNTYIPDIVGEIRKLIGNKTSRSFGHSHRQSAESVQEV